jgi:hypothetical protein
MVDGFSATVNQLHRRVSALLAAPVLGREDGPLELLRTSIGVQDQATVLVSAAVTQARQAGHSWHEIGDVLGVSRQAAFQRFGKPTDPRTGEPMNTTPLPKAAALAEGVIDALSRGSWEEVTSRFDERMRDALTSDGLAAAWAQVIGTAGAFEHHGEPEVTRAADFTITNTPLTFEAGEFTARISFRDDQTVAGLFILPADTPQ